ncbi:MAG: ATPase, T2SS/T4P/T4SS family [Burkholderiales bacterium]|nr:ATPase, T2SS/T4P/T4SS family [Burkholderiales bacterium]
MRLRCSAYSINAGLNIAASVRVLPSDPPRFEEIGLPASVAQFAMRPRGLLLVTGPTGSGKTTTMASLALSQYLLNGNPAAAPMS